MAAASGSTGGPTPSSPPFQRPPSTSFRSGGSLLNGTASAPSGHDALHQASADLTKSAAADPPQGHDCPDGTSLDCNTALNSQGPNPNLHESQPRVKNQPSYATTVTSGKSSRPPPAFVTNLTAFHPVKRGNASFLKMPEDLYQRRLSAFTFALIGRIFLPKHSPPRPLSALKSELQQLFKTDQDWSLTPLGKGFYSLKFSSHDDHVRASRATSWKLKLGSFFVREWKPNFDPYKEQTSITQLWVRLFHLPEEYWDPNFLVGIFRAVGNVVKLDGSTAAGTVGHFARALVEVDLSYPLAESVTIEGCSSTFVVEFGFENIPLYCSFCRYIGHSVVECKSKKKQDDPDLAKGNATAKDRTATAKKPAAATRQPNVRNRKEQTREDSPAVPTNNAFKALAGEDDNDALVNQSAASTALGENANPVRDLVPLSEEAAKALEAIKNRDFSVDSGFAEDVLSDDAEVVFDEKQGSATAIMQQLSANDGVLPDAAASPMQQPSVSNEGVLPDAAVPSAQTPGKESHAPSSPKEGPTEKDGHTLVESSPVQAEGIKLSAAAKRRAKEMLRKNRTRSSMKTRSSFDTSSDTLQVLADKRRRSVQVPADSIGQPHGGRVAPNSPHPKAAQLEGKLRTAMEQDMPSTLHVLDTGQSRALKAMGFAAKQRWGDILDFADSDDDFYDLMS